MQNLGKILLFLIMLSSSSFAMVTAEVEPKTIYEGETAAYILTLSGDDIEKPILADICGNDIVATSSQTSIESINGSYKKSYTLSYSFTPRKNCTIEGVKVKIDSKVEVSNSVDVLIKPRSQDFRADFILSLSLSKKELYVGEPFELTLLLKQKEGAKVVDSKFIAPEFKGFWIKSEGKAKRTKEGEFSVTKVVYKLAPQREGTLHINAAQLKIATRVGVNNWGTFVPQVKWNSYYSNSLDISVKALPNNAKIIGDFTLKASVEKNEVNPNEPVNVTLEVKGEGNLEDIESFKPYVSGVNVFDEKIIVKGDTLSQKLVFVSDKSFVIPSFELVYFDTKTQKLKKIITKPIEIKVNGNLPTSKLEITRDITPTKDVVKVEKEVVVVVQNNYIYITLAFVLGLVIGVLSMFIRVKSSSKKSVKFDMKNEKLLLVKLLAFKDTDSEVAKIVDILESNIYTSNKQTVDKKILKKIIKKYEIS